MGRRIKNTPKLLLAFLLLTVGCSKNIGGCYTQPFEIKPSGINLQKARTLSLYYSDRLDCEDRDCWLVDQIMVDIPMDTLLVDGLIYDGNIYFYLRAFGISYYAETTIDKLEICTKE